MPDTTDRVSLPPAVAAVNAPKRPHAARRNPAQKPSITANTPRHLAKPALLGLPTVQEDGRTDRYLKVPKT